MHPNVWEEQMFHLIAHAIDGSTINISVGETDLRVVAASTRESHKAGLSVHDSIPRQGMLFMYQSDSTAPFTRKEMAYQIDIRFYDSKGDLLHASKGEEGKGEEGEEGEEGEGEGRGVEVAECPQPYRYVLETPPTDLEGPLQIHKINEL